MQTRFVLVWAALVVSCAVAQLPPFAVLPDVPKFVEDNAPHADLTEFVRLWKQTLENDGQGDAPTVRINFEPKTIVAPNDFQMRNIVPQHVTNPLLDLNSSYADLRREFLLDHILLDPVQLDDPALNTEQGLRMMTFSGKDLIFRFDHKLGLVADGVAVTSAMSLHAATKMLTTDGVLFDAKLRVNNVAQGGAASTRVSDLDSPLGPPLELGNEHQVLSQPQPPAPLTQDQLEEIATALPPRHISPPALPPGAIVHPPAAPPAMRGARIVAPPAGPPVAAGKSLLSTAEEIESKLLPVEHRTLDSDEGTSISGSPQAFALSSLKEFAKIYDIDSQDEALKPGTSLSSHSHSTHKPNILPNLTQQNRHPITSTENAPDTEFGSSFPNQSKDDQNFLHTNLSGNASPSSILLSDSPPQVGVPLPGLAMSAQEGVSQSGQFSVSHKEGESQFEVALPPHDGVFQSRPFFESSQIGVPLPGVGPVPAITSNDLNSGTASILELLEHQDGLLDELEEEVESITDIMKERNLGACLEMLEDTGLLDQLLDEDSGTFLLLSPSNEALARLSSEDLQELKESQQFSYHVIPLGDMPAPEVTNDSTFTTLLGQPVRFNVYGGKVFVNGAGLLRGDIKVPRGTIQVVDAVLRPPYGDVQTVLQRVDAPVGRTATLVAMHGRALHQDEPVTVLAPLDASITSKGFSWPDLLENSEMASGLLGGHTVSGSWYTEGLVRQRSLMSTAGVNITFRSMGDGTITANGIPLLMSDLSATDGVVHVVADLIPNADLGTDHNQIRTPLFNLIHDGGIKASQNHFDGLPFSLGSAGAAAVKSVHDSTIRQQTNLNVGVPLPTSSGNVPQLTTLYQTPIQESFDFNQVLTQSTQQSVAQSSAGTQNDGYGIAAPDANLTPFSDSGVGSAGAYGVQDPVVPSEQHEGPGILEEKNNISNNVQLDLSGDTTYGIQDQLESLGSQEGLGISLSNNQNIDTSQITPGANFALQEEGSITEQQDEIGLIISNQETNDFMTDSSFSVTSGADYGVQGEVSQIDQQQDAFTSSNADVGSIDYQLTDANINGATNVQFNGGYEASTQSNDDHSDNLSVITSVDQTTGTVGVSDPANLPSLDHSYPIVELPDQPTNFDATSTIVSAPAPVPEAPSFLTLYNAPNLSPADRRDPFTEVAAPELTGKQFLSNKVDTLSVPTINTQKALLDAPTATNSLTETVNFVSIPKPTPGVINPFDLSDFSNFASFKKDNNETSETNSSNLTNNHDSFFVITKGDLNLQDIISTLDENIRKDIQILKSPSIFFNSSVTQLALQNPLPENLLSQIRNSISSNNNNPSVRNDETFRAIGQGQTQQVPRSESQSVLDGVIKDTFDDIQMVPLPNASENITLNNENEVNLPTATSLIPETTETTEFFDYEDLAPTTIIPVQIESENFNIQQSFPQTNKEFMSGPSHEGQSITTPHVVQRNRPHLLRRTLVRASPLQQQNKSVQLSTQSKSESSSQREALNQTRQTTRQRQRTTVRMQVQQHFKQAVPVQNTQSETGINQLSSSQLTKPTNSQIHARLPNKLEQASTQKEDEGLTNSNPDSSNLNQTMKRITLVPGTLQIQQDARPVSLQFQLLNDSTTNDLPTAVNQSFNFPIEEEELQLGRQKSLAPISGLFNLLELQDQEKHIRDQRFPIIEVSATETSIDEMDSSTNVPEVIENLTEHSTLLVDTTERTLNQVTPQVQGLVSEPQVAVQLDVLETGNVVPSSLEEEQNVIEFLKSHNLTAFADMIRITGLNRDMIRGGPWTIFAPSNEGVEIVRMSGGLDLSVKDLRHLTAYHVVPGVLTSDRFREGARLPTLYAGYSIYMKSSELGQWSVGGGLMTGFSTTHPGSSTWVVHEVDRVLYAPHGNLLTTISLAPALTRFTELLTGDSETQQILQGRAPVTVFAPSNAAMGRIRPDVRPSSAWLMAHIVEGFHYSVCFPRNSTLPSLAATSIATTTNHTNGVVSINGVPASYLDITASNGVLHVLDDLVVFS